MTRHTVAVLVVLSWLGAASQAGGRETQQDAVEPTLPKMAREALEKRWKKTWTPAEIDQQAASCRAAGTVAPKLVSADVDGDNQADYAMAVKTPAGVQLVALLYRQSGYQIYELDPLGGAQASAVIGLERRGTRFVNAASSTDDFYSADTVAAYRCGSPTIIYIWTGSGFRRIVLGKVEKGRSLR